VRLIAVTGIYGQIYQGDRRVCGISFQCLLKPENAAIEFGSQSDRAPEESDELPVTVAARHYDLAHIGGGPELFNCLGDGRMEASHRG
jgi:hypothetical protein